MARKTIKQHAMWREAEVGDAPPRRGKRRACVVYPGPYAVAMANLGYQWLMHALANADFAVARVVWPEAELLEEATAETLRAIDDDRPARAADVWFVSVSFENDLSRLAGLLRLAGLSPWAEQRREDDPLIVAGGVAPSLNPEPISAFADVCLLGEGPAALDPFLAYFATHDPRPRESFLRGLSELPNAYVGRYYQSSYDEDGRLTRLEPLAGFRDRVVVVKEKQIDPRVNRTHLRAPESAFGDALLVETARGCVQRCRFCAAGHLFLPYRPAPPPDDAWSLGQEAVGLVGSNVSGHPQLDAWLEWSGDARPALSSIRFNTLTAAQWRHLAARGLLTAALAPETGAERLRRVCNKPITDEAIVAEVERAVEAGVRSLKLYFMIGLPTETPDDVQAIVELTRRCREAAMRAWKGHGRAGALTVSLNPFVPKPHTPFQWSPFGDPAELRAKIGQVRSALRRLPNIELQAESLPAAMLQAILSIGDRRVAELAVLVDQRGSVRPALRAWSGDLDRYLLRPRTFGDVLPWDRVDPGVSRRYLEREYEAALAGRVSPVCFTRPACRLCGAC